MKSKHKPVFLAAHPRACSTAFERMFFTRADEFECVFEIFQYPFHYGPERMGKRFANDPEACKQSGYSEMDYKWAVDQILSAQKSSQEKRVFVKDMAKMFMPPGNVPPTRLLPSLQIKLQEMMEHDVTNNAVAPNLEHSSLLPNPTVFPLSILDMFHFTFLIRHPRRSIPSLYRLSRPPMCYKTGLGCFDPDEVGYAELRRLFDYLKATGSIGPAVTGQTTSTHGNNLVNNDQDAYLGNRGDGVAPPITVVDADDLLSNPHQIMITYCKAIGCEFRTEMLRWSEPNDRHLADQHYLHEGFHDAAIISTSLGSVGTKGPLKSEEECYLSWTDEFGKDGADVIQDTVTKNILHYDYLRQYRIIA